VLGNKTSSRPTFDEDLEDESEGRGNAEQVVAAARAAVSEPAGAVGASDDDDDTLSYFAKLAAE
ncbi:MAG: single-stranded DNA-binding protein, partial [Candidatus Thermoplasmatota archaeon]|nr:single-stranded DNA-binding protein [Candidatus Thermoplasmatota archaeon]